MGATTPDPRSGAECEARQETGISPSRGRIRLAILVTGAFATLVLASAATRRASTYSDLARLWILCLGLLGLAEIGGSRLASLLLVGGLAAYVTTEAIPAGGMRSPGASAFLVVPLIAYLTLGESSARAAAVVCAGLGLALVALETQGNLPPVSLHFGPMAYWLLECAGLALILGLIRTADRVLGASLAETEAELARRLRTEDHLAQALEAGEVGTWEFDPVRGHFHADPRGLALFGFDPGNPAPVSLEAWSARVHPDDLGWVTARLGEVVAGGPRIQVCYRAVPEPGVLRWVESAGQALRDPEGRVVRVAGTGRDVTARRRSEEERERLVSDLAGRVRELQLLHGTATLVQSGRPVDRSLLEEFATGLAAAFCQPDRVQVRIEWLEDPVECPPGTGTGTETAWTIDHPLAAGGTSGRIEVAYRSIASGAGPGVESGADAPGIVGGNLDDAFRPEERALLASAAHLLEGRLQRDAQERLRSDLERQLRQTQKLEALGNLAGGIAHDFNNILAAIVAEAELARETLPEGSPARVAFEHVLSASGRARDLVQRIRAFSRRQELIREPVRLAEVVEEALDLLRATLPASIRVTGRYASDLPLLHSNPTQLHQILLNLGTNALHAMTATGGELRVEVDAVRLGDSERLPSNDLVPGTHLHLSISDTGVGMEPEVLEHAFEPFFTTKGVEGTGLGLSVVHGIVREHAGAITVRSRPGEGTTFDLWFPVRNEADSRRPGSDSSEPKGGSQRILVVDDEEALAHLMVRTLERLGYRATGFRAPALALQAVREDPTGFDALVTDLSMPGMTGLELAAAVRAIAPALPIAISTGRTEDLGTLAPALGIEVVIAKPAKRTELAQALARLLAPRKGAEPLPAVS